MLAAKDSCFGLFRSHYIANKQANVPKELKVDWSESAMHVGCGYYDNHQE